MTTMELFEISVGLKGVAKEIDELSVSFDIDFFDSDIREAVESVRNAKDIGNSVWLMFTGKLQDKLKEDYLNFDEEKFDWVCNGCCSRVYYDGCEINKPKDLEKLLKSN